MEATENVGNPLGRVVFDKTKFLDYFVENAELSLDWMVEKAKHGNLAEEVGSRVHSWRIMLGLIPSENSPIKWIERIRNHRLRFQKISDKYSIHGTKNLDPMMFNPLMGGKDNLWNEMLEDKDIRETIFRDVIRTYQEYKFFKRKEIRDQMVSTLYYWSKTYPMFSYRQGMNEIIAVIYFVFYAEHAEWDNNIDKKTDEEIAGNKEDLVKFLYNEKHINADIFSVFERVMSMGIKELYGTIDDISSIKRQLFHSNSEDKDRLFKWKYEIEQEELSRRKKIEQIYDDERKRSAVMRRCNRIYHHFLKNSDSEIYKHLVSVKLDPELQLMRWLRCILSREFNIDITVCLWDYIFAGVNDQFRQDRDFGDMYYVEGYSESKEDPLINLDYLWLAMIENIRDQVHKKDIEDCLEVFFHYPEVKGASRLIALATKIESAMNSNKDWDSEYFRIPSSFDQQETNEETKEEKEPKEQIEEKVVERKEVEKPVSVENVNKPKFFDPLSSNLKPSPKKDPFPQFDSTKNKSTENNFAAKRIDDYQSYDDTKFEKLDDSPVGNSFNQKSKKKQFINTESPFAKEPEFGNFEKEEYPEEKYIKVMASNNDGYGSNNIMGYLSGGLNKIKEINKQYVDPFVKKGINNMANKWSKAEQNKLDSQQKQIVIHEKLKKLKRFLVDLSEGSSLERSHISYVTLQCEEEKLYDIIAEVETMMQMTDPNPENAD
jgi:hypothetical protein